MLCYIIWVNVAPDTHAVRWSRPLRALYIINFSDGRQVIAFTLHQSSIISHGNPCLTHKWHSIKIVVSAASVDQDQAAQNVQPDIRSTLSAMLEHYKQRMARNLITFLSCRIKNIYWVSSVL